MKPYRRNPFLASIEQRAATATQKIENSAHLQREIVKVQHYYRSLLGSPEPTELDCYSWLHSLGDAEAIFSVLDNFCDYHKHKLKKATTFHLVCMKVYAAGRNRRNRMKQASPAIPILERVQSHLRMEKRERLRANDAIGFSAAQLALTEIKFKLSELRQEQEALERQQRDQRRQQYAERRAVMELEPRHKRIQAKSLDELDSQRLIFESEEVAA